MSESNIDKAERQKKDERKKRPIIYWIIILVLLFLCISLFVSKNQIADSNRAVQARLDSVSNERTALQEDFNAASAKIDQLVTDNAKLDSTLTNDRNEIVDLQKKIRGLLSNTKATSTDLAKARQLITTLNVKTSQYEARIAELEKENAILSNKNSVLIKERDSTVTQNIAIKRLASVLHASNVRIEAIHKTRSGREKGTSKARKADLLRIVFDIDENRVAENGPKQIYVRIMAPDGQVLNNMSNGSGMLLTAKGDQIQYSVTKEVPLIKEQPVKDVVVDWNQEGDYGRGTYFIELYSEGYKIGGMEVRLR
ncbi:MAG: hypothetical protein EBZ77_09065 [Chitinophagia bacterium]|nr:hypothetical protein [Chitinophagia bacterium]